MKAPPSLIVAGQRETKLPGITAVIAYSIIILIHLLSMITITLSLETHRLITANGPFICYAWPHWPSATEADYSTTDLLFVMHGHTGPQPPRLITA